MITETKLSLLWPRPLSSIFCICRISIYKKNWFFQRRSILSMERFDPKFCFRVHSLYAVHCTLNKKKQILDWCTIYRSGRCHTWNLKPLNQHALLSFSPVYDPKSFLKTNNYEGTSTKKDYDCTLSHWTPAITRLHLWQSLQRCRSRVTCFTLGWVVFATYFLSPLPGHFLTSWHSMITNVAFKKIIGAFFVLAGAKSLRPQNAFFRPYLSLLPGITK